MQTSKNTLGILSRNPLGFARALALIAGIETLEDKGRAMGMDATQLDDLIAKSGDALIDYAMGKKADTIAVQLESRGFKAVKGSHHFESHFEKREESAPIEETEESEEESGPSEYELLAMRD